jgi:hypothetical protein
VKPALAVIVLALTAGAARADIGPIVPATKFARPVYRIETAGPVTEHVFLIKRYSFNALTEVDFVPLATDNRLIIPSDFHGTATLLIVPRTAATAYQSAREVAGAVDAGEIRGSLSLECESREIVPSWVGDEITITYRLQKSGSGEWQLVRTSRSPMWQWYVAAGFVTLGVIVGGWRVVRWLRRPRPLTTAK